MTLHTILYQSVFSIPCMECFVSQYSPTWSVIMMMVCTSWWNEGRIDFVLRRHIFIQISMNAKHHHQQKGSRHTILHPLTFPQHISPSWTLPHAYSRPNHRDPIGRVIWNPVGKDVDVTMFADLRIPHDTIWMDYEWLRADWDKDMVRMKPSTTKGKSSAARSKWGDKFLILVCLRRLSRTSYHVYVRVCIIRQTSLWHVVSMSWELKGKFPHIGSYRPYSGHCTPQIL